MPEIKKTLNTVDLLMQALGLIKTGAIIFGMMLIEWARAKQKIAENKKSIAETNLDILIKQQQIQKEADAKNPDAIIDDYLHKQ